MISCKKCGYCQLANTGGHTNKVCQQDSKAEYDNEKEACERLNNTWVINP